MKTMVERTVDVLDEVGVCPRNDQHYRTIILNELSPDLLGRYKKRATAQSSALAKAGDHKKSHKRYKGVNTATTLQFRNDVKKHDAREKRKKRNLTVIDKNTGEPSFFSRALQGYGTNNRDKDGRVISRPINPDYWKEPEDPVTRYTKGLEKQRKKREKDTHQKNIDYDTDKHNDKVKYRGIDVRRKEPKPSKTTGERGDYEKEKEKQRKDVKQKHPSHSLKWSNHKWVLRQNQKEEIEKKLQHISEISIRTIGLGVSLAKVKQWANKCDRGIQKLRSLGSSLQRAKDETERNKIQGEITIVDAEVLQALRSMEMYSSLVTTAGTVGLERSLLKKLNQRKRK
jgi:hypothetical protein